MNMDEKEYLLKNPLRWKSIEAVGLKLLDRADYLVGVYLFWNNSRNVRQVLNDVVRDSGEARLYMLLTRILVLVWSAR